MYLSLFAASSDLASSPADATCSGQDSQFVCTAPVNNIVSYQVYVGEGCLPNSNNNNWADMSNRFSKQITICKPCRRNNYWIGIKLLDPTMNCNFKLYVPKLV
ncbi:hypothetical protein GUITHDRAFT_150154 [Guillardia theta CCMP2712]|uniref:Uncharacterized protein n=1 Tax=Guillardia theta (strain CCMP2712) TaxID=905079 RepID=L1K0G5_GUITC|nr:hypothetical protein GUITHDRAFT_150154 [Guillardia theta CCMP2712]EKX54112.1 hypothetical protein GUITHDRAFT_150154 [Guillardia theta CCMP2712]|eukprot:XP_005841092.1 hypothetical protein GUITHDRAFT_150154 [Guillardia theta CCMP2712]